MPAPDLDVDVAKKALEVFDEAAHEVVEEHLDPVETALLLRSISQIAMYGLAAQEGNPDRPLRVIEGELGEHFQVYWKLEEAVKHDLHVDEWWATEGP